MPNLAINIETPIRNIPGDRVYCSRFFGILNYSALSWWEKVWWTAYNLLRPDFGVSDHFINKYVEEIESRMANN